MKHNTQTVPTIMAFAALTALSACGGSSDKPPTTYDNRNIIDYVSFMKTAYSETLENRLDTSEYETTSTEGAVDSPPNARTGDNFNGYSRTNVEVSGVDEANTLKFNGQLLQATTQTPFGGYQIDNNEVKPKVHAFSKAMLTGVADENPELHLNIDKKYLYEGLLNHQNYSSLVGYAMGNYYGHSMELADSTSLPYYCLENCPTNDIIIYTWQHTDSSNNTPIAPEPIETHIDGNLIAARAIGHRLFIVSRFTPHLNDIELYPSSNRDLEQSRARIEQLDFDQLAPQITVAGKTSPLIENSSCTLLTQDQEKRLQPNVTILTSIDVRDPSQRTSTCVLGETHSLFVTSQNAYLINDLWQQNTMEISKFSFTENSIDFAASGTVEGSSPGAKFHFGEIDNKLAVVNTLYNRDDSATLSFDALDSYQHQLTVLEQQQGKLIKIGQIPNADQPEPIGKPGELIYAVRFMNKRAYVVTFEKVDPLYVIDLADPNKPKILGELEIPGFSSYLHPIDDNLIIGVGKNAKQQDGTTWFQGLNIRLFDVSDPSSPRTLSELNYGLRGSDTPVFYQPHSFSYVADTNTNTARFTLPMTLHGDAANPTPNVHANHYYNLSEMGLYQFEVNTDIHANPTIVESGRALISTKSQFGGVYEHRSVIDGEFIYYKHKQLIDVIPWGGNQATHSFLLQ